MQRHPARQSPSAAHVMGWQVSPSQRSSVRHSPSVRHSGPGTHRNPSQRSGGGQSALVMQRGMGVQLPTRQSCPTGQSASRTHSSRGTQRRSRGLQISPLGQSVSRPHPVATQRASWQRAPTPQSSSPVQSPVNTHRAPSQENPTLQSSSPAHSPVNTHRPDTHEKPSPGQGVASEQSGVMTQTPSTQSSSGPQSPREVHSTVRAQRPSTQRSPGSQSPSLRQSPENTHSPRSQRSPGRHSKSPRQRSGAGTQLQLRHTSPSAQSASSAQLHGAASGTDPSSVPPSPRSDRSVVRAHPTPRIPTVKTRAHQRMGSGYRANPRPQSRGLSAPGSSGVRSAAMNLRTRTLGLTLVSLLAATAFAACGEETEEEPLDTTPIVGLYELPISRNNQGSEPSNAARIEISPTELRLNHRPVLELTSGRLPEGELADHVITKLRQELTAQPARGSAALEVHANVPYQTLVTTLNTVHAVGLREVHIAVRTLGESPSKGWMPLTNWRVIPNDQQPAEFSGRAVPWSAFTEHWREVYDACRAGQYIDCDGPYASVAEGGDLGMTLWTRGQGMKVTFRQTNAPEPEAEGGGGGPALIEGIAPAPAAPAEGEEEPDPATEGAFTVRHQESVDPESALSALVQPVCGNQGCQAVVEADATGQSMRVISMIGAVFPNGFTAPELAFRLPE